ncbi:MAG: MFS transporter [Lachnospiraceae bacterium]|nr:MFS transporter [Lachnospiraceae bacterium]
MKKLGWRSWLLLIFAGFGYQVLNGSAFLINSYYTLFANGMNLTALQVGTCMTMVGVVTTIGYLFGGILGDIFKTKTLMLVSHFGCAACLLYMTTFPPYKVLLVIEFLLGFFAIGTYWGSMTRFVKSLGPTEIEGKLYGFFYGLCGLSGTVIGLIVSAIVANSGNETGLRLLLTTFAVVNILAAVVILIFYRGYKEKSEDPDEKFKLEYLGEVIRMPEVWMVGGVTFCAEMIYSVMAYVSPMLEADFAVSAALITVVVTIRVHFVRLLTSPSSGLLVDKLKSPLKVMKFALWGSLIITIIMTVIPWTPAFAWIAIAAVLLMSILFNLSTPCWFTTVAEIGVHDRVRATAVGLACTITFSGDMWTYALGGKLVDSFGSIGYRIYFCIMIAFFILGLILCRMTSAKIKTKKAAN